MCGATSRRHPAPTPRLGLSPRVRGNPPSAATATVRSRSIPACAGQPRSLTIIPFSCWVYPRVCGATITAPTGRGIAGGLSPRVRGNRNIYMCDTDSIGSIPACAGQPGGHVQRRRSQKVYPRVCGATSVSGWTISCGNGLSPRVRGNPAARSRLAHHRRSIPACAGQPTRRPLSSASSTVYPRVCGATSPRTAKGNLK